MNSRAQDRLDAESGRPTEAPESGRLAGGRSPLDADGGHTSAPVPGRAVESGPAAKRPELGGALYTAQFPVNRWEVDPMAFASSFPESAVQLRTISYVIHRDLHILVHDIQDPDQSEWDKALAAVEPYVRSNELKGVLVRSFGGGPTPSQRRQVIELYQGKRMPVANVSDSAVTRAITTAMSWFYRGTMRSYSPRDLPKAISYLGTPEPFQQEVLETVVTLCGSRGKRAL